MTAELLHTEQTNGAVVEVWRIPKHTRGFAAFEIRTSTGYLATFLEDHIDVCDRKACDKSPGHSSVAHEFGRNSMCHGLHHLEHAIALAKRVAKTYGSASKGKKDPSAGRSSGNTGRKVLPMSAREWAESEWVKTMERRVEA